MADENGEDSSSESDVAPILYALKSDPEEFKSQKRFTLPDLMRGSVEESVHQESKFGVPNMEKAPAGENPEGEEAEDEPPAEDEAPAEEEVAEPEPEATPEPEPEPESPPPPEKEKKTRVQVDPNASVKDTAENSHYLTALPVVPESETPYTPILYTFRVKAKGKTTKLKNITTKPPPFYLQFDHTIAVVWTLFNKEANKDNLGIVQLQWALHFLQSLYNSEGVHPMDVQLCIDTIQSYLIDEYAEMSEESVMYGTSKFGDFVTVPEEKKPPFSVNYSQMIKRCPQAGGLDTTDSTIMLDKQLLDELENVKKVVGIESIDLTKVVSKDQVMNILNDWKKEQIERIQDELKMLYVVEDMMKNSDSQNFEGYTDESQFETVFRKNT